MPGIRQDGARPFQYRPGLFFFAAFVATWIPWFMAAYQARVAAPGSPISPLGYLGLLGPLVVTLIFILASGSRALRADFLRRFDPRRLQPGYVVLAIAIPPVAIALAILLSVPLGQSIEQFQPSSEHSLFLVAIVLAPIIEEISWRGYGVDSLRAKWSVLRSTLIFAALWSLWHAPLVLLPGTYQHQVASMGEPLFLANFFVGTIPAAIIANWLYYANGRSILIGVLFHAAANGAAELLSAGQVAKTLATGVWAVVALIIVVFDRKTFGAGPRNFIEYPSPH